MQPLNPPDLPAGMATPPQHSRVVPGESEPGISNQSASHVPAAPKGAGEGWEAWRTKQLFAFLEEERFFLSAPV